MRLRKSIMAAVLAIGAATTAWAAQGTRLSAEEARAELFGVELAGLHEGAGDTWRECIEPSGRTLYERGGLVREGRLRITEDGRACFAYRGEAYASCFWVVREGANYRFNLFVTRVVRRGVARCGAAADAVA